MREPGPFTVDSSAAASAVRPNVVTIATPHPSHTARPSLMCIVDCFSPPLIWGTIGG